MPLSQQNCRKQKDNFGPQFLEIQVGGRSDKQIANEIRSIGSQVVYLAGLCQDEDCIGTHNNLPCCLCHCAGFKYREYCSVRSEPCIKRHAIESNFTYTRPTTPINADTRRPSMLAAIDEQLELYVRELHGIEGGRDGHWLGAGSMGLRVGETAIGWGLGLAWE